MARLKSRQRFIPNGFKFYDPNLKWSSHPNASFQTICDGLKNVRMANPGITKAAGLSTDSNAIAEEVDRYNAAICQANGWTDFITDAQGGSAAPAPFPQEQIRRQFQTPPPVRSTARRAVAVAAGAEILVEWIASGAEAVPQEQADRRATVCANCPMNEVGGWETWFTVPVANAIRKAVSKKHDFNLATPRDADLGICTACDCPMTLKVWMPFQKFFAKMPQESKDALHPSCWIRQESAEVSTT